ncbi:MAG: GWxTD domain-containing protein, partial [Thermoanaerobaculia bacterium]|nr:GWxTD domain-containing protein [Thermoanaerobaculia bacterium]
MHPRLPTAGRRTLAALAVGLLALALLAVPTAAKKKDPRLEALPPQYLAWLDSVALLISDEERDTFLDLEQDYQRDAFIERFWRIRDPYPDTTRNEMKEQWDGLLTEAMDLFGSLEDVRSEILLLNGIPDGRIEFRCSGILWDMEVWFFRRSPRVHYEFFVVFYQRDGGRRFALWRPREGMGELLDNSAAASGVRQQDLWFSIENCPDGDVVARILRSMLANPLDWDMLEAKLTQPSESPSPEWVATFDSYSTDLPPDAEVFEAELLLEFPSRYQTRTVMAGTVSVAPGNVGRAALEGRETYDFLLSGEVLRDGRLFENFRYKFGYPAATVADTIPMTFERRLRPGSYQLVVKVEDLATGRFFREARDIEVPELGRTPGPPP